MMFVNVTVLQCPPFNCDSLLRRLNINQSRCPVLLRTNHSHSASARDAHAGSTENGERISLNSLNSVNSDFDKNNTSDTGNHTQPVDAKIEQQSLHLSDETVKDQRDEKMMDKSVEVQIEANQSTCGAALMKVNWKRIAIVFDRTCFFFYALFQIFLLIAILNARVETVE